MAFFCYCIYLFIVSWFRVRCSGFRLTLFVHFSLFLFPLLCCAVSLLFSFYSCFPYFSSPLFCFSLLFLLPSFLSICYSLLFCAFSLFFSFYSCLFHSPPIIYFAFLYSPFFLHFFPSAPPPLPLRVSFVSLAVFFSLLLHPPFIYLPLHVSPLVLLCMFPLRSWLQLSPLLLPLTLQLSGK